MVDHVRKASNLLRRRGQGCGTRLHPARSPEVTSPPVTRIADAWRDGGDQAVSRDCFADATAQITSALEG
jgi:hypothetical protein